MRRLWRIEQAKAAERMKAGVKAEEDPRQKSDEGGRADEKTAEQFGISRDTMKKEMQIVDNKDLLTPEDFADWDEGKLSTKKTYKTAQKPCTAVIPSKVHRCTRNGQEPTQGMETRFFDYTIFRKVSYDSFLFFGKGKNKPFCFSEKKQPN